MILQGDIWWAELPAASGSAPAYRRPVIVVQGDSFNQSAIQTVVCVTVTSNLKWADSPGNVSLTARASGLPRQSVANISQVVTLDKADLAERVGRLSAAKLSLVLAGLDTVLGR